VRGCEWYTAPLFYPVTLSPATIHLLPDVCKGLQPLPSQTITTQKITIAVFAKTGNVLCSLSPKVESYRVREGLSKSCMSICKVVCFILIYNCFFYFYFLYFSSHLYMALLPQDTEHVNLTEDYIILNTQEDNFMINTACT
jgi:hypothetical protein